MSYILEALRRADADRQRGAVPGLHAQPPAPAHGETPAGGPARVGRTGLVLLLGCGLVLALATAWWLGRGAAPVLPPRAQVPPLAAAQQAAVQAAATVAEPSSAAAALPATPPPALPATLVPAPAVALASPAAVTAATTAAAASAAAKPAALPPAVAASAPEPPIRWSALPEAVRSSVPPLALSGGVYAEQPSQRLLIVNGQVAREGDELAPGLWLEQIRPRSAVLRWRGQRFEMPL